MGYFKFPKEIFRFFRDFLGDFTETVQCNDSHKDFSRNPHGLAAQRRHFFCPRSQRMGIEEGTVIVGDRASKLLEF